MSERESMSIEQLRNQYIVMFGHEPTERSVLDQIESQLSIALPSDFREISSFYSGGIVGGISHHAIETSGPANNIVEETIRMRKTVKLPHSMMVLAEPPASLIVLLTEPTKDQPAVIWLDSIDVSRLDKLESLHNPQVWNSYADFFGFLLDREAEERA